MSNSPEQISAKTMLIRHATISTLIAAAGVAGGEAVGHGVGIPGAELVGSLTATGFVLWYAWYVTARLLPKRDEQFNTNLAAVLKEHAADREKFQCHAGERPT